MQLRSKKNWMLAVMLLVTAVSGAWGQGVSFTAEASSTRVGMQEPFRLTFSVANASRVSAFEPPTFTGFEVLSQSQSQSTRIINGQMSQSISFVYILRGSQVGRFTIAAASARVDGNKLKSNPITITVTQSTAGSQPSSPGVQPAPQPAAPNPFGFRRPNTGREDAQPAIVRKGENAMDKIKKNVFVRVDVDKTDVYVGQQITATYKLYTRLPTSSQVTKVPSFTGFSAHDIKLSNPPRPMVEQLNGVSFRAFTLRKTMLFPLRAGTLSLDPVDVDNTVRMYQIEQRNRSSNPFGDAFNDPFFQDPSGSDPFSDPFFQDAFGGGNVTYHDYDYSISSKPVTIHVKALPEAGKPAGFDGAVGSFNIKASLDKHAFSTDDAATLTVTVSGQGNITLVSAPKVTFPPDIDSYDPKITDKTHNGNPFGGSRTFSYVLMAKTPGRFTIPAVQFSYFDPEEGKYKTVSSASFTLDVSQGKNAQPGGTDYSTAPNTLQPIRTGNLSWSRPAALGFGSWWYWLLLLLPVGVVIALLRTKKRRDSLRADQVLLKNKRANRVARGRLSQANRYLQQRDNKAFYGEVSQAVWGYLSDKLAIPFAELSKQAAQDKLAEKHVNGHTPDRLFQLLDHCEMALYAGSEGHAEMQKTYSDAISVITALEQELKK